MAGLIVQLQISLGRMQEDVDLKLQPGEYVAPSHAPISDVKYRVEVRVDTGKMLCCAAQYN